MKFRNMNWAPYLLLLPSFIYLMLFFAWPMVQALQLAFRRDSQILPLRAEPAVEDAAITGELERGTTVELLDVMVVETQRAGGLLSDRVFWLEVAGIDPEGERVSGWALRGDVFVADASRSSEGTVRTGVARLRAGPALDAEVIGELPQDTEVALLEWDRSGQRVAAGGLLQKPLTWLRVSAETEDGEVVEGWLERSSLSIQDTEISSTGRVQSGRGVKEWTLDYVKRMVRDARFDDAVITSILLVVLILPVQFVLAIIMALVLQSQLRFNSLFLYLYAIPLGISDLAAGLVWYTIFTQTGYLNSFLQSLGLIDRPFIFISSAHKEWIIIAIVLAEIWRATSLVMVIVVSGLQAIPRDYLEAGEVFGASLWQRLRHIILPLLKPSLQVALILRTILAFQVFAVVVAISGGDVLTVLANEAYRWYDIGSYNNKNVAAAYSGFIMLLSLGVAVLYLRTIRTQEEKGGRRMTTTPTTHPAPPITRVRVRDLPIEQQRAIRARRLRRAGTYAVAIAIAVWILLPIWLIGTLAFSTPADVRSYPKQIAPIPFSTDTMEFFLNAQGVLPATRNSIVVALLTLVLSTAIAAPAGYAIARYFFRGRDAFRLSILAVRAFPIVILAVPLAETFRRLGMFDEVYSVALMHTALTLPTTILVVSSVFASVPRELEEAAKVFGCSAFQAFLRVALPLALPGVAASAIFTFVMSWNEVFASVVLTLENRTLPALILYNLDKSGDPFKFAGGFFMLVPSLIFIFFVRRYLFNMWGQITK